MLEEEVFILEVFFISRKRAKRYIHTQNEYINIKHTLLSALLTSKRKYLIIQFNFVSLDYHQTLLFLQVGKVSTNYLNNTVVYGTKM